ncbi:Predicted amidophosphoribosyltransferases [Paraoerskovia marina]|uniref:Predicted amidophosphoribosyltransferases n=1 Tax=Paraoerskovia marina TaxID=545619 RepID=A0A1H1PDQ6_9CELL|nr:Predicted amidophosphoribosyltransferases [Paraoerskovia marina]
MILRQLDRATRQESDSTVGELSGFTVDDARACRYCHSWKETDQPECENCLEVRDALGSPPIELSAVTLYRKPSALRDWLTGYKGRGSESSITPYTCRSRVRAILARMFFEHGAEIFRSTAGFDGIVVVPSTARMPPHELVELLESIPLELPIVEALRRGPGELGFRRPCSTGFVPIREARGRRVLIVDDVYTTGARINSAAAALHVGGIEVAGSLVIARRVNPEYRETASRFWEDAQSKLFTWSDGPYIVGRRDCAQP